MWYVLLYVLLARNFLKYLGQLFIFFFLGNKVGYVYRNDPPSRVVMIWCSIRLKTKKKKWGGDCLGRTSNYSNVPLTYHHNVPIRALCIIEEETKSNSTNETDGVLLWKHDNIPE
jgi:hypothetical protein